MNRYTARTGALEVVMIIVALIFMIPAYVLVNLAIRPESDTSSPLAPTTAPTFDNFTSAWAAAGLGPAMLNSGLVTVVSVLVIVALSSLAAYPLARITARWSSLTFYGFMVGILVPFQLSLIPLYKMFASSGLLGTILPLILIYIGGRLPFSIFLYMQFLRQVPLEYEEAAALDGANAFQSFLRVTFPMLRPVTGTVVILNGLFIWNDFFQPLLYLSGTGAQTVPVAIYSFVGEFRTVWPNVFAGLIIGALPVLVAFFFIQKSLIRGFAGGLKG